MKIIRKKVYLGVDEVGCGALAGPIVAAAVGILTPVSLWQSNPSEFWPISGVKDSKKVSEAKRKRLVPELIDYLLENNGVIGIGTASAAEINKLGHAAAIELSQQRALKLAIDGQRFCHIILDGNVPMRKPPGVQLCVPQADSKYWLVAAASLIAKDYRDQVMCELSQQNPDYMWHANKGYAGGNRHTSLHIQALLQKGKTPHHRDRACRTACS